MLETGFAAGRRNGEGELAMPRTKHVLRVLSVALLVGGVAGCPTFYILTISSSPQQGGHVLLDPAGGTYALGTRVTVEAIANAGWEFANWEGNMQDAEARQTSIVMNKPEVVTAFFVHSAEGEGEGEGEGETWTIMLPGGVALEMVWIPAGTFLMGRYPGELDSYSDEDPQRQVTFAHGFRMSKYEVTQAQWRAVMGDNPSQFQGDGDTDNRPVEQVSWDDAQSFIAALNDAHPGMGFRLPSEAEWEYACRAGTTTRFYWGNDPDYTAINDYAWYASNSGDRTHDVGGTPPNAWGLYDMSGNVWEWVQDWYHNSYTGAPTDGSGWESPAGTDRVRRGGSWLYDEDDCRSALRSNDVSSNSDSSVGFRLAR